MDNFGIVRQKLEAFIRRFYLNELLKGLIFFIAIGLLYLLFTVFIEYLLWLDPTGRTILFWTFIGVETFLLGRFIIFPLLKIFKISKGIDHSEASKIIGRHFPEVNDKLLNVLQLKSNQQQTDLLMAGIDQKARELRPVPFSLAVDFRKNLPFLKYAAIPVLIILLIVFTGQGRLFTGSYERVVNYKVAYEPPAPFSFKVENPDLSVRENEILKLRVMTQGKVIPENVSIHYLEQTYFMNEISPGIFKYNFEPATEDFDFFLSGNKVNSRPYSVEVVEVPKMQKFQMHLDYPRHTGLEEETLGGTGNATVPEGTLVTWDLETAATERVELILKDTVERFGVDKNVFSLQKSFRNSLDYQISTSNKNVHHFENLSYAINVVKDEFPRLLLESRVDSLNGEALYFYGKVSDDYGINQVRMLSFPVDEPGKKNVLKLNVGNGNMGEFLTAFPDTLKLQEGKEYEIFFEVIDNDAINGFKKVKSRSFFFRSKTDSEKEKERLEQQNEAIQGIDNSLEEMEFSKKELQELNRLQREKPRLDYNDRKRLEQFLERQKRQNELMKSFTQELKNTLQKKEKSYDKEMEKELKERLEKREKELKKNEDLLKELEKYSEKIEEEGLNEKLEKLAKGAKNRERNLEQLLELTRRYYVQEKQQQLANQLEKMAGEQKDLAEEEEENSKAAQDTINSQTEELMQELEELQKENERLQKPMETGANEGDAEEVQEEQEKASKELQKGNKSGAKEKQKKAGEKMMQMSQKMKNQMQAGGMEQMQEDVKMLRQILDNLLTFSFEQEDLMEEFKKLGRNNPTFSGKLRKQNVLKEHFQHVDDSLYLLALRNPMITENINSKLINIEYDLDKALDRLAQNDIMQGVGSQQYVITGANDLAYFLSSILGNMEQMMSMSSSGGGGKGMQLPDIIRKQKQLNEEMKDGLREGKEKGSEKGGEKGGENESEENSGELFRIFQEQQMLRMALQEQLNRESEKSGGKGLKKEMENIEEQLLDKGFNRETYERMKELEHKLLDLEDAELEQGNKPERESETNKEEFRNPTNNQILRLKEYFKTTEILNRQSLPLRQIYKQKVKEYFERGDN